MSTAKALGKMGDKRAVEPLIKALKDKAWFIVNQLFIIFSE